MSPLLPTAVLCAALLAAVPALGLDADCKLPSHGKPVSDRQRPGASLLAETPDLKCGGAGDEICSALRAALLDKKPPAVSAQRIQQACSGRGAEAWTETWQAVIALQRGHSGAALDRASAERALQTALGALFATRNRDDAAQLQALKDYYLNKTFVLGSDENAKALQNLRAVLEGLKAGHAGRAGRVAPGDWENWLAVRQFVESHYITPGSTLADDESLLRDFDAVSPPFDVEEFLRNAKKSEAERERFVKDGRLTPDGLAIAETARQGRMRLRLYGLQRAAASLQTDRRDHEAPELAAQRAALKARAERLARQLGGDDYAKALDDLPVSPGGPRRPGEPPPLTRSAAAAMKVGGKLDVPGVPDAADILDARSLPKDIPAYLAQLNPTYTQFLLGLSESDRGKGYRLAT